MGWSCTMEAARVLDAMTAICRASTGSSNVWVQRERGREVRYFTEIGVEQEDGSVIGEVWQEISSTRCRLSRTFKITPGGAISCGGYFERAAACAAQGSLPDVAAIAFPAGPPKHYRAA